MYVDNKKLYADICDWLERRNVDPQAKMGDFTARAIILIANNLVKRWNFQNYTYKDEMALDAIEICARYLHKFDVTKYKNPHAYITKICEQACITRLKKESRQTRIKYRYYLEAIPDLEEYDDEGNPIQVDYSFFKDIGEKLKEGSDLKKAATIEEDTQEDDGLMEFLK